MGRHEKNLAERKKFIFYTMVRDPYAKLTDFIQQHSVLEGSCKHIHFHKGRKRLRDLRWNRRPHRTSELHTWNLAQVLSAVSIQVDI